MKQKFRRQRGFTLIEVAIVVAVVAILAAILIPSIMDMLERSRERTARGTLVNMQKAFARFHQDTGFWPEGPGIWNWARYGGLYGDINKDFTALRIVPTEDAALRQCEPGETGVRCWNGPYLLQDLDEVRDPWGRHYRYFYIAPSLHWAETLGNYPACDLCDNLTSELPTGALVIYSLGKDGLDATGCEDPKVDDCMLEPLNLVRGEPSVLGADDIVIVVSSSAI